MQHLLWGDWLKPLGSVEGEWVEVRARGETSSMFRDDIQEDRLLEVNFVDIGQGDGCLLVSPEDKFIVIDAGEGDDLYRFLRWRFGGFKERFTFESAVITHPDQDHYKGFKPLFEAPNVHFGTVFHNGIVERNEKETLGPRTKTGRPRYLTDVISDREALKTIIGNPEKTGKKNYPICSKRRPVVEGSGTSECCARRMGSCRVTVRTSLFACACWGRCRKKGRPVNAGCDGSVRR